MYLSKPACFLLVILGTCCQVIASEVKVFEIGQGNCVAVKYGDKVILVDAGSTESNYEAQYVKSSVLKRFDFEAIPYTSSHQQGAPETSIPGGVSTLMPSRESPHSGSSQESVEGKASKGEADAHKQGILKDVRNFLTTDIARIVVVLSHSDDDHNNLLPKIFNEAALVSKIETIILGGFADEYISKGDIGTWLETNAAFFEGKLIYTGSYDGSGDRPLDQDMVTEWRSDLSADTKAYARPYWSFLPDKTGTEQKIENALRFGEGGPQVQVLCINGGFMISGSAPQYVTVLNPDPNANSIVLRFLGNQSLVIPGDAEGSTWNHIIAMYKTHKPASGNPRPQVETDYMLLSHHGSKSKKATTLSLLEFFNPKFILISVGRMGHHHHPSEHAVKAARDYLHNKYTTSPHYITYFSPDPTTKGKPYTYKRLYTTLPIFSTVTNGTLTFTLFPSDSLDFEGKWPPSTLYASRSKRYTFKYENRRFFPIEVRQFNDEGEMKKYIDDTLTPQLKTEGKNIEIWAEDAPQPARRPGKPRRTYEIKPYNTDSVGGAPSSVQPMDIEPPVSEGASSSSSPPLPVPIEVRNFVIRHKIKEGVPDQWILYSVEPVEDEK